MRVSLFGFTLMVGLLPGPGFADPACKGFKWDVTREQALFAGTATLLAASTVADGAPVVELGRLYELGLHPQESTRLAAPPSKRMLADGASAGMVRFRVSRAGEYRVALSRGFWVDIVEGVRVIAATDFGGVAGCESPRKLVTYPLPADRDLVLQFSGAVDPSVRVSITEVLSPAR